MVGDVRLHRFFFVQLNPPPCDHKCSFNRAFRCQPSHKFRKQREGIRANWKKHEHTTVLKKQKRTICALKKCWLNRQLACFEGLRSLEKKKKTSTIPTPSWSAVPFFAVCRTKAISVKTGVLSLFSRRSEGFPRTRKTKRSLCVRLWNGTGAFFFLLSFYFFSRPESCLIIKFFFRKNDVLGRARRGERKKRKNEKKKGRKMKKMKK